MATKTRPELDTELAELEAWMPTMQAETEDDWQLEAFAGRADEILDATAAADHEHVWSRLQCILRDAGLIPGDDEPCSD